MIYWRFDVITNCYKVRSTRSLQTTVVGLGLSISIRVENLACEVDEQLQNLVALRGRKGVAATSWRPGNGRTTFLSRRSLDCPTGPTARDLHRSQSALETRYVVVTYRPALVSEFFLSTLEGENRKLLRQSEQVKRV